MNEDNNPLQNIEIEGSFTLKRQREEDDVVDDNNEPKKQLLGKKLYDLSPQKGINPHSFINLTKMD